MAIVSPLSMVRTASTLDVKVFGNTTDLISFHVFLILFQFRSKYLSQ